MLSANSKLDYRFFRTLVNVMGDCFANEWCSINQSDHLTCHHEGGTQVKVAVIMTEFATQALRWCDALLKSHGLAQIAVSIEFLLRSTILHISIGNKLEV